MSDPSAPSPASPPGPAPPEGTAAARTSPSRPPIRFDRNELAGAFGDIGTDLPLIVGMILAAGLDSASVLTMFGVMQIATGLLYRLPMAVQPLKAMAAIVISNRVPPDVLYGGGLAVGVAMLVLAATDLLRALARLIPPAVIRGIQFGLGLQLATLALRNYVLTEGLPGYALAAAAFLITVFLLGNRRFPAALFVIALGVAYAFAFTLDAREVVASAGVRLPAAHLPGLGDVLTGLVVLALPQIPLSLGNSVLATQQAAADLFPGRAPSLRRIGVTYGLMNLVNPVFGGVPTCHGSGGLVGHYTFGGRTGGSVILYGGLYLLLGVFFSGGFERVIRVFPLPMLGVLLLFEGLALMTLIGRLENPRHELRATLLIGLLAGFVPYGYVLALAGGPLLLRLERYRGAAANADGPGRASAKTAR